MRKDYIKSKTMKHKLLLHMHYYIAYINIYIKYIVIYCNFSYF